MRTPIYFDYAAATPMDASVLAAMQPYFNEQFYNPSALYLAAKSVSKDIANTRQTIAGILGSKPSEIIFTAGGTEANNLAIHGVMQAHPEANIVISAIEHDSVLAPAAHYDHQLAPVDDKGIIDVSQLTGLINDQTVLVSLMLANNEIGTVQPLHQIAQAISDIRVKRRKAGNRRPLYLHTDAAQATAYLDIHVSRLGVDLMTINGGKIYGPKQSGLLFIKTGTILSPQILGGGQERGYRSGTENVASIIGLGVALQLVTDRRKVEGQRVAKLQHQLISELEAKVPQAVINGSLKYRLPNNLNLSIPGTDNERLMMELDERGIMCATGSACSASSDEPSHVLGALGCSEADIRSSLRVSFGIDTTTEDITHLVNELADLTKSL